jgi:hypothetical protein
MVGAKYGDDGSARLYRKGTGHGSKSPLKASRKAGLLLSTGMTERCEYRPDT